MDIMTNQGIRKLIPTNDGYYDLDQLIFDDMPDDVDWAGVDYDGTLHFGKSINPRISWASERWRGYTKVGEPIKNCVFRPLTSINRTSWRWTI